MTHKPTVSRYQWKDPASSTHLSLTDRMRTFLALKNKKIKHGKLCIVKPHVEIRLTENAILEMGDRVILDSYVFIQLTKPKPHMIIGSHVGIGRYSIIAAKGTLMIGDYTQIGPHCQLIDHNHSFSKDDLIMNQRADIKGLTIGSDCWLGSGVRVLSGVTIGDGSVIGAGSVVTNDIPSYEIWAGSPAKFIRKRT